MKNYSLRQLRAISYSYSRRAAEEAEKEASKIEGMYTAYQNSDYVYLRNALKNKTKCFAEAEKNLKNRIRLNRAEFERAKENRCKQFYLDYCSDKIKRAEEKLKIVQSGIKKLNKK